MSDVRNFAVGDAEAPPRALQTSECNELLDPTRTSYVILVQRQPGKLTEAGEPRPLRNSSARYRCARRNRGPVEGVTAEQTFTVGPVLRVNRTQTRSIDAHVLPRERTVAAALDSEAI